MEEQFILRVPPSVAERLELLLNENPSEDSSLDLDLSFTEDGRTGTFCVGHDQFPASLLDLPTVVESYKTYDDNVLIKTADIGQMIMVSEDGDHVPDDIEYKHGLTPPMRDARRRRFRREPDLNPELVKRVENDICNIMKSRSNEAAPQEEDGEENTRNASAKKPAPAAAATAAAKPDARPEPSGTKSEDPGRSDSEDSDDSI